MNVLARVLANPKCFGPANDVRTGTRRVIYDQLRDVINSVGDFPMPDAALGVSEVQVLPVYNGDGFTGGTLKLDFIDFQTAAMPFDISTAGVQAAVDAAWLANVPGYTAGDISAQGGPWTVQDIILVYEGDFFLTTPPVNRPNFVNVDLVGDGGVLADTYTYASGTRTRRGYAALLALGIIAIDTLPAFGADLSAGDVSVPASGNGKRFPYGLDPDTVRALIQETEKEEGNETVGSVLLSLLNL